MCKKHSYSNLRSLQILYITVWRAEISHYFQVKNGMKINSVTQSDGYTAKTKNLFWPHENSIEKRFAANIVQDCQQYCSALLSLK